MKIVHANMIILNYIDSFTLKCTNMVTLILAEVVVCHGLSNNIFSPWWYLTT